jgi:hypothetical protein
MVLCDLNQWFSDFSNSRVKFFEDGSIYLHFILRIKGKILSIFTYVYFKYIGKDILQNLTHKITTSVL